MAPNRPIGNMRDPATHMPVSGAVGDDRGVVQHVCPVADRDFIMDGSLLKKPDGTVEWEVQGDDTENLATHANHILGATSLSFDKANGGDNTKFAGFKKTDGRYDLSRFLERDLVEVVIYVSGVANIANVHLRLGKDASNYNTWTWADTLLTAPGGWTLLSMKVQSGTMAVTGTGWDPENVSYVALLVEHDAETDLLPNIRVDSIRFRSTQGDMFSGDIAVDVAAVEALITASNVLLGTIDADTGAIKTAIELIDHQTASNSGNKDANTQRVVVATDDINLSGLLTKMTDKLQMVQITDGTTQAAVIATLLSLKTDLSSVAGIVTPVGDGAVDTGTQRVTLANDDVLTLLIKNAVELIDDCIATIGAAFSGKVAVIGAKAESTVPTEVADGQGVAIWADTFGRLVQLFTDLATQTAMVTDASPAVMQKRFVTDWATQTAPNDVTATRSVRDYANFTISYLIANIDTSVGLIIWGSLDGGVTFHPIWAGTILAADDQDDVVVFENMALTDVYCEFDAEAGGVAATVTWQMGTGNG